MSLKKSHQKPDRELRKFRKFVDGQVPGGISQMSDTDVANLRNLVDTRRKPEVAQGLIREMDALLELEVDGKEFAQCMTDSAATGVKFDSPAEARAWLLQFRAFLAGNLEGGA